MGDGAAVGGHPDERDADPGEGGEGVRRAEALLVLDIAGEAVGDGEADGAV